MYCANCGRKADGRFCAHCGAPLDRQGEQIPAPTVDPYLDPAGGKPKRRGIIVTAIVLAAVLLAAAAIGGVLLFRHRQIAATSRRCSESLDYLIGSQKDKPVRLEQWDPAAEKFYTLREFSYNSNGCLEKTILYSGATKIVFTYRYNSDGVPDSGTVTYYFDDDNGGASDTSRVKLEIEYDDDCRIQSVRRYQKGEYQGELKSIYEDGTLIRKDNYTAAGEQKDTIVITRDRMGRIVEEREWDPTMLSQSSYVKIRTYVYDDEGRLEGVVDSDGFMGQRYVYED